MPTGTWAGPEVLTVSDTAGCRGLIPIAAPASSGIVLRERARRVHRWERTKLLSNRLGGTTSERGTVSGNRQPGAVCGRARPVLARNPPPMARPSDLIAS